jgi:hypothetical protein
MNWFLHDRADALHKSRDVISAAAAAAAAFLFHRDILRLKAIHSYFDLLNHSYFKCKSAVQIG